MNIVAHRQLAGFSCSLLLAGLAAAAPAGWWDEAWTCCKTVQVFGGGSDPAVVTITTGGQLRPDAADLRVIDQDGREVPYHVITAGFEDLCTVAFPVKKSQTVFNLYYGNRFAEAPAHTWAPKRGLVLEVRTKGGGGFNNWKQAQQLLENSREVQGRALHPCVFDGRNRFGPSDNYISIYRGYLNCLRSGDYGFATTSDDASFLLIDSKMVVQWPGVHGAVADARHNKAIRLDRGLHLFEYYHFEGGGGQVAEAAWRPPGADKFYVIPPEAFAPFAQARVVDYKQVDDDAPLDFSFWQGSSLMVGNTVVSAVQFRIEFPPSIRMLKPEWDFGDGTEAAKRAPMHVYVVPDTYRVTLHLGDRSVTQKIRAWEDERITNASEQAIVEAYAKVLATYDFETLRSDALPVVADLGVPELKQRAVAALADAVDSYRDSKLGLRLLEHAETLRKQRQYDAALNLLKRIAMRHRDDNLAWRALYQKGCLELVLRQAEEAQDSFERLESRAAEKPTAQAMAFAGLGNVYRHRGQSDKAREYYAKAQATCGTEPDARAALRGAHSQAVLDFLRRGECDAAREEMERWEMDVPVDRFDGYLSVLKAITLITLGELAWVQAELEDLLAANPRGNFASHACLLLGDCLALGGDKDKRNDYYRKVTEDYPESHICEVAASRAENPPLSLEYLLFPILDF